MIYLKHNPFLDLTRTGNNICMPELGSSRRGSVWINTAGEGEWSPSAERTLGLKLGEADLQPTTPWTTPPTTQDITTVVNLLVLKAVEVYLA